MSSQLGGIPVNLFSQSAGGSYPYSFPQRVTFCPNCTCAGCQLRRDQIETQKAAEIERLHKTIFEAGPVIAQSFDDILNAGKLKPGSIVTDPPPPKYPKEKGWIPWRLLGWCVLLTIGLQIVAKMCGRVV